MEGGGRSRFGIRRKAYGGVLRLRSGCVVGAVGFGGGEMGRVVRKVFEIIGYFV